MSDEEKHRQSCSYCLSTQGARDEAGMPYQTAMNTYKQQLKDATARAEKAERERDEFKEQMGWVWQWQFLPCRNGVPGHEYAIRSIHSRMGRCPLCKPKAEAKITRVEALVEKMKRETSGTLVLLTARRQFAADILAALTVEEEAKG